MSQERRVLFVDDDAPLLATLDRMASRLGIVVRCAANGEAALELLRAEPFDLVVSDMRMPRMNGYELLCAVRAEQLVVAEFVILSGYHDVPRHKLLDAGATAVLDKPVDFDHLCRYLLGENYAAVG